MNLKRIDFVARSYENAGADGDEACGRIAFFRPLWGIQAKAAEEAAGALEGGALGPSASDDLLGWYWKGTPVLSQAPVPVDPQRLAATARSLAGVLAEQGGFDAALSAALAGCSWDELVAATPVELAGRNPGAYLDACGEIVGQNLDGEETASIALLVLALALRPQLEPAAEKLMGLVDASVRAAEGTTMGLKPRTCPVCGGEAALAHVGPTDANKANVRTLHCSQCGASWEFERVRCARCGTQSQEKLHYRSIEGDDAHRLHVCDSCRGYLRSHFALEGDLQPFSAEVEDVVMARLDIVAAEQGFGATAAPQA